MFRRGALLATAGWLAMPWRAWAALIGDVTGLYGVEVARVEVPGSTASVSAMLRSWPGLVAVGDGYGYGSQGRFDPPGRFSNRLWARHLPDWRCGGRACNWRVVTPP